MKVIVTGGAGFIGSHLVERLLKEKKIIVIDCFKNSSIRNLRRVLNNKKIFLVKKNICNKKSIVKYFKNCKIVFHLAAIADIVPSIKKPLEYLNNNFMGTLNVLECMRAHNAKKMMKLFKNIKSYFPKDGSETNLMIKQAYKKKGPVFISLKQDPRINKNW